MPIRAGRRQCMPRRGANIYRRKDGRWEGRVKKDGTGRGPRKYISVYGKTYGDVKERMEHIRGQLKRRGGTKMVTLGGL